MPYEQFDNSASLFRNDKRETEQQPQLKGSAKIGGEEYWVSCWVKLTKTGDKWFSLSFTPKDIAVTAKPSKTARAADPWDDDIGF